MTLEPPALPRPRTADAVLASQPRARHRPRPGSRWPSRLRRAGLLGLLGAVAASLALPAGQAAAAPPASGPLPVTGAAGVGTVGAPALGQASMGWRAAAAGVAGGSLRVGVQAQAQASSVKPRGVAGIDVSGWQGNVNWARQVRAGRKFAYVKATEGSTFRSSWFRSQYDGSAKAGMIRGAYHFANPAGSGGVKQARFFVANGGGWSADGRTLPGVLDIEYNPYGATCYGKRKDRMVAWVDHFTTEYKRLTGRDAVIYTTTGWWKQCTGNSTRFATTNPLWLARYGTRTPGELPGGWTFDTFWQYTNVPIDQNRFNGSLARLKVLAADPA